MVLPSQNPKKNQNPDLNNTLQSVLSNCSIHPRLWLIITILSLQVLILFITRSFPLPLFPAAKTRRSATGECPSGRVYVYNLPTRFNRDLVDTCNDSDPWHWRCGAVSNDGFGPRATELAGIVPESLSPAWYWTNQFASEILYHNRLLNYKCRTLEPESATAFYMPFYAGLAVGKYLWQNQSMRDRDCAMLLRWVQSKPFWGRSNGSDHFIALGRITWDFRRMDQPEIDWGSSFINMPAMRHVTRLVVERAPRDDYDVGVPYPTGFHPRSQSDIVQWQSFVRNQNRTGLFCFVGAARSDIKNDFRGLLLNQCRNESDSCRLVDCARTECANGRTRNMETFLDSDFCLQPRGDSYTRRSVFDCMLAGSIPVFFWFRTAYGQYEWFLPGEPESYSVFIDPRDVRNGRSIKRVLERYSREDVRKMREKVIELIPNFLYAKTIEGLGSTRDAVDIAIDGVLKRFRESDMNRNSRLDHTESRPG
ncbi:xyloglucan galactosyltransferase XLT2-like [Actinidia eriantha]|uniref:xyloglucan galactosyltransferase XLT2-like n=1 Tax=Actinidia eriantha TaxID=165200 RepID=UPI0025887AF4|nr:xyloglucan galactosyltransferase XLT2-like [Actinidia eriantha]